MSEFLKHGMQVLLVSGNMVIISVGVTKNFKIKEIIIIAGKQQQYQNAGITVSKKESKKKRKRKHERENYYVFKMKE